MGREKALSAALQLQHDDARSGLAAASDIAESDFFRRVAGGPWSAAVSVQVMPSYRVHRATHYMMAMGLWRPPVDTGVRTPLPSAACNACTSCQDCFPDVTM